MEKQKDVIITLNDKEVKLPKTFKEKILWLGPSLVLCSIAIRSGEAIITPYFAAMYGLGLLWVPVMSALCKVFVTERLARDTHWQPEKRLCMVCTIFQALRGGLSLSLLFRGSSLHSSWL